MADSRPETAASNAKNKRINKIYRTPPTPTPEELLEKEKGFILDNNAVSNISSEFSRTNPKLGPVLPPYNAQKDIHVANYFEYIGVKRTLDKTGQVRVVCVQFGLF